MTAVTTAKRGLGRVFPLLFPLLLILWVLLVLYPNPVRLATSVQRLVNPGIDTAAVESAAASLPDDPAAIEDSVLESIPYGYDWQVYGMPWYFPTVNEVMQAGEGDCKGRALVLASVLEAKDIPYSLNTSPIHVWVDYEGKEQTEVENQNASFYQLDPETGQRSFGLPSIDPMEVLDTFWGGFWSPMPAVRKALLLVGLIILIAARVIWSREAAANAVLPVREGL
jgi:hypothetical protein